jgi:colanic acid biosynthesis protein WcaH
MEPKVSRREGQDYSLSPDEFSELVRIAPLVSIDVIVRDGRGRVLLGRRNFEPAKGSYFVPGGRILKDEPIRDAFSRILRHELGADLSIDDARFVGVHEHFHPSSRFGPDGSTTHYVVLAYEIDVRSAPSRVVPDDQHSALEWVPENEILRMPDVHELTKAYFAPAKKSG